MSIHAHLYVRKSFTFLVTPEFDADSVYNLESGCAGCCLTSRCIVSLSLLISLFIYHR